MQAQVGEGDVKGWGDHRAAEALPAPRWLHEHAREHGRALVAVDHVELQVADGHAG